MSDENTVPTPENRPSFNVKKAAKISAYALAAAGGVFLAVKTVKGVRNLSDEDTSDE